MRRALLILALLAPAAAVHSAPAADPETGGTTEVFWEEAGTAPTPGVPPSFADLAEALSPAVVNLRAEQRVPTESEPYFAPRGPHSMRPASGSGFVISADGYLVTNNHVIEDAERLVAVFQDGAELPAKVVGRDVETDLALLKVETERRLAVAPLGSSASLRVGDWVIAIGNPFGLDHSVTVGILSAKGRRIHDSTQGRYDDFLQTDASINPGNSGGPLIDTTGRVVGINTAVRTQGQGIGFAVPIDMAKELLPQLRAHGSVTRGWLGVQIQKVDPPLAKTFGLEEPLGALVSQVFRDSPAAQAEIEHGDIILEFGGEKLQNFDDLPRRVAKAPPGSEVEVLVLRGGKPHKVRVLLGQMPVEEAVAEVGRTDESPEWGLQVAPLDSESAAELGLPEDLKGVLVRGVKADSPAARAGLQQGDVILQVEKKDVETVGALKELLEKAGSEAVLFVQRADQTLYVVLERE